MWIQRKSDRIRLLKAGLTPRSYSWGSNRTQMGLGAQKLGLSPIRLRVITWTEEAEPTSGVTYVRNKNQNGSLNEELSNKGELNKYQGCFRPAGDFRRPDICSQEQEGGVYTEYVSLKGFYCLFLHIKHLSDCRLKLKTCICSFSAGLF